MQGRVGYCVLCGCSHRSRVDRVPVIGHGIPAWQEGWLCGRPLALVHRNHEIEEGLSQCAPPYAQVLTYGLQNNDPAWVRQQALLGVHAVIVDDVARVAAALHQAPIAA